MGDLGILEDRTWLHRWFFLLCMVELVVLRFLGVVTLRIGMSRLV